MFVVDYLVKKNHPVPHIFMILWLMWSNMCHFLISVFRIFQVLHFATHISWKLAAIVVSPGEFSTATTSMHGNLERMDLNDSSSDINASFDGPPLSDFLLTAADILNIKISARLVVLSSGHSDDRAGIYFS